MAAPNGLAGILEADFPVRRLGRPGCVEHAIQRPAPPREVHVRQFSDSHSSPPLCQIAVLLSPSRDIGMEPAHIVLKPTQHEIDAGPGSPPFRPLSACGLHHSNPLRSALVLDGAPVVAGGVRAHEPLNDRAGAKIDVEAAAHEARSAGIRRAVGLGFAKHGPPLPFLAVAKGRYRRPFSLDRSTIRCVRPLPRRMLRRCSASPRQRPRPSGPSCTLGEPPSHGPPLRSRTPETSPCPSPP